jgi:hypothetical protein
VLFAVIAHLCIFTGTGFLENMRLPAQFARCRPWLAEAPVLTVHFCRWMRFGGLKKSHKHSAFPNSIFTAHFGENLRRQTQSKQRASAFLPISDQIVDFTRQSRKGHTTQIVEKTYNL